MIGGVKMTELVKAIMEMLKSPFVILGVLLCVFAKVLKTIIDRLKIKRYEATAYFEQTKIPYKEMLKDIGRVGEYYIFDQLKNLNGYKKFLFNCYIPKSDAKTTEIDVIMLHETGIYVFESKNYSGWIFGNAGDKYWTQTLRNGRYGYEKNKFYNPVFQNDNHIKWLKNFLSDYTDKPFISYIAFSDRCRLMDITLTNSEQFVMHRSQATDDVTDKVKKSAAVLTTQQIDDIFNRLYPLTQATEEQKTTHIEEINRMKSGEKPTVSVVVQTSSDESNCVAENEAEESVAASVLSVNGIDEKELPTQEKERICPNCGAKLIKRAATKGERKGKSFWGCENFPKCRYIENID